MHLRDAHYRGARTLGHGVGYVYPHDDPRGAAGQEYRPDEVAGNVYWSRLADGDPGSAREDDERE
jgi:replication-associated recombination protein RarA